MSVRFAPLRNRCALSLASRSRGPVPLRTTHVTLSGAGREMSSSIEPPQPISRSSECAPMHSTSSAPRFCGISRSIRSLPPEHPRAVALRFHAVERDLVLERIHRLPEAVVPIGHQPLLLDQSCEGFLDELFALVDVVEDLPSQSEEAAVDPELSFVHRADAAHHAVAR